nr:metal ABC transporter permease [Aeromonas veronii]
MESLRQWVFSLFESGYLPEMFQYAFLTNALVAALLMGPLLGALGPLVVVKRLAFFSEAVGHGALTGVALGILLGGARHGTAGGAVLLLYSVCPAAPLGQEPHPDPL